MSEKMSSLRFDSAMGSGVNDCVEFSGFARAVMGYVFRLPCEQYGNVESIHYYSASIPEKCAYDRCARVSVKKDSNRYFFYVVAEVRYGALQEWKVIGQSVLLQGPIRSPDYEKEMIWVE